MCLAEVDFFEEEAKAFPGVEPLTVRPGRPGDQFDIDKFLAYSRAMYTNKHCHHVGVSALIPDYRTAFQEHLSENGPVNVAVTPSGYVAGFAYALNYYGESVMDFMLHPNYMDNGAELLQRTAAEFKGDSPLMYLHHNDLEREQLVRNAGFAKVSDVPERFAIYRMEK